MTEDNVRQMWSDAELDAALHDLHREAGSENDPVGLAAARTALLAAAGGAPAARRMEGPPAKKRGGSWRWIAVAAAVAALTGGLVVAKEVGLPGATDIGGPVAPPDRPVLGPDVLKGIDLPVPAHGYRYVVQSEWVLEFTADGKNAAYIEQRLERWIPADPRGQWQVTRTQTGNVHWLIRNTDKPPIQFPIPGKVRRFALGGNFDVPPTSETGFPVSTRRQNSSLSTATTRPDGSLPVLNGWRVLDAAFITSLPADAGTLRKMLALPDSTMPAGDVVAEDALRRVRDVLEIGLATGPQRVALCQALAMYPGVTVRPDAPGPGGTRGLSFEVNGFEHLVMVVDPATAQLVGSTETDHKKTGDILSRDVNYLESTTTFSTTLKPGD